MTKNISSNITQPESITEEDIASYLLETPDFFQRHTQLLMRIQLIHPHNGRAISLADRQIELQRERYKILEQKLNHLIRVGKENVSLAKKLHIWMLNLVAYTKNINSMAIKDIICSDLQTIFDIPGAIINTSQVAKNMGKTMLTPRCGLVTDEFFTKNQVISLLNDPKKVASLAVVPITDIGLLILISDELNRFSFDMDTEFLIRLSELIRASLYE